MYVTIPQFLSPQQIIIKDNAMKVRDVCGKDRQEEKRSEK